MDRIDRAVL